MMKKKYPWYFKATNLLVGFVTLCLILIQAKALLMPLALAFLLALSIYPFNVWLEDKKVPRTLAISITLICVILVLLLVSIIIVGQVAAFLTEVPRLTEKLEGLFINLQIGIEESLNVESETQIQYIEDNMTDLFSSGASILKATINATSSVLLYLSLIPLYTFLILLYRENWKNFLFALTPDEDNPHIEFLLRKITNVIKSYIGGLSLVMLIIGILNCVGLTIIGLDYAIFFGILAAFLTVIPYFGVALGSALPATYALLTGDTVWYPIIVLMMFWVIQFLEGNFITPYVMSSQVNLNALAIIFVLLCGGFIWGAFGMILAVPFLAIANIICQNIEDLRPISYLIGGHVDD